jgi:hypothetical protein
MGETSPSPRLGVLVAAALSQFSGRARVISNVLWVTKIHKWNVPSVEGPGTIAEAGMTFNPGSKQGQCLGKGLFTATEAS